MNDSSADVLTKDDVAELVAGTEDNVTATAYFPSFSGGADFRLDRSDNTARLGIDCWLNRDDIKSLRRLLKAISAELA